MITVGELSLWVAVGMAVWGAGASFAAGTLRSGRGSRLAGGLAASGARAVYAAAVFSQIAAVGL
ncbi:MAG: hypothetical protein M3373_07640, partial [Gemmatimonadota bacterium]|nr:hypothetical protein [Gemmatimonadota bacterium]